VEKSVNSLMRCFFQGNGVVDKPRTQGFTAARDRAASKKAAYLAALFAFFFPFALCGCGGALRMRLSAASKGTGVLSGFGCALTVNGV
jgi:hypothetical protein